MSSTVRCRRNTSTSIWYKESFVTTNPSRILIHQSDYIIDLIESIIKEDRLKHHTVDPSLVNVSHKGETIDHDT